jgi:hypothetical protein
MDYEQEIEGLKLLLDAERSAKHRLQELLNKANYDKDRYAIRIEILQDELDDIL